MHVLKFLAGNRSVTGNYRKNNEDRVHADPSLGLFIVADGMGGQLAGEQASQMAVQIIPRQIAAGLAAARQDEKAIAEMIRGAVFDANRAIMQLAAERSEFQSMGTTVVLALVVGRSVYITGIGDSRAYLVRGARIEQLTTDHSLAQALVEARTITADEARQHRFRNILYKYLGSKDVGTTLDVSILDGAPGDRFLLASDGLTGVVSESDILRTLGSEPDPQRAAESLVAQALANDSRDNVSAIALYLV